jgi:phosphohistidine phosphatase SixA
MSQSGNDAKKRRRRARARLIAFLSYSAVVIGLAWFFESQATTTVIFVRHADIDAPMSAAADDAPLNATGRARAELLADVLADVDVVGSVNAIYASPAKRTQQTAEPLASRLGLEVEIDDPYETVRFMREILREHKGEIVLIVTHSDAIAPLIDELHGSKRLAPLAPDEYDKMWVVTIPWSGKVKTLGPLPVLQFATSASERKPEMREFSAEPRSIERAAVP